MAATLDDVRQELIANRKVTDDILKTNSELVSEMTNYFRDLKDQAKQSLLNQKEKDREAKGAAKAVSSSTTSGGGSGGLGIFGIPALGGLGKALAIISGGIVAIELALAGFRGWELRALKGLKNIGADLKGRASLFGSNILDKINKAFASTRVRILKLFGLGVDGKPIVVQGEDGKFKVPTFRMITNSIKDAFSGVTTFIANAKDAVKNKVSSIPGVTKVTESISKLFSFVTGFVSGTTDFIKNAASGGASKVITFLKNLGLVISQSGVAGFAGVVGKVVGKFLWPLGLLMSGYEAVMEFINTEGSILEKTVAGVYGFVASFIGAPLDLLKSLITKALSFMFIKVDSEGNVVPGLGKDIIEMIEKFSFQEYIKSIPQKIADIFNYILDFFKDPVGIAGSTIKSIYGTLSDMFIVAMRGILSNIPLVPQAVLDMFATDREKLAAVNAKINQQKAQLSMLNSKEDFSTRQSMAIAQVDAGNYPTVEAALAEMDRRGIRDSNYTDTAFIAQQKLINDTLAELAKERTELLKSIAANNQSSIVDNSTNINTVQNQGLNVATPVTFDSRLIPGTTYAFGIR